MKNSEKTPVGPESPCRLLRRWRRGERGAVLIEAAVSMMFLIPFTFGVLEYTYIAQTNGQIRQIAAESAREGAAAFSILDPLTGTPLKKDGFLRQLALSDFRIIESVQDLMSVKEFENVERVIVYKADSSGVTPKACIDYDGNETFLVAQTFDVCNVFFQEDLIADEDEFLDSSYTADDAWPAVVGGVSNRQVGTYQATQIGVTIVYKQPMLTKMFGNETTMKPSSVVRHEPQPISYAQPSAKQPVNPSDPNASGDANLPSNTKVKNPNLSNGKKNKPAPKFKVCPAGKVLTKKGRCRKPKIKIPGQKKVKKVVKKVEKPSL